MNKLIYKSFFNPTDSEVNEWIKENNIVHIQVISSVYKRELYSDGTLYHDYDELILVGEIEEED